YLKTDRFLDSLYQDFAHKSARRFELGETNYLETITAESKQKQLQTLYHQALQDVQFSKEQLKAIVQVDTLSIVDQDLEKLHLQSPSLQDNSGLLYYESAKTYQNARYKAEKQNLLPGLNFEYFQGTNDQLNTNIKGYQFGIKIPLLFFGNSSKIKALKIAKDIITEQKQDYEVQLNAEYKSLITTLSKYNEAVNYYDTQGKRLKNEIIKTANRTFKEGEIDFFQYIQSLETAKDIELSYLDNLNAYNQTVININHLILKLF
ncbi:TolC family protein, partial [Winogradskyella sediminis]|uniref:TolC family protein n=1 Tax=Winogradskyella sediminis TaxID=1382466 RepID=UPI003AA87E0C